MTTKVFISYKIVFCTRRRPYVVETYVCTYYCNLLCYVKCSTSPLLFKPMSLYHIQSRPSPSRASCCPSPCLGYVHGGPPPSSLLPLPSSLLPPPSSLLPPCLQAGGLLPSGTGGGGRSCVCLTWAGQGWTHACCARATPLYKLLPHSWGDFTTATRRQEEER